MSYNGGNIFLAVCFKPLDFIELFDLNLNHNNLL